MGPYGLTIDGVAGDLLVADTCNQRVRRISASTGLIGTMAGNGSRNFGGDGELSTSAQLNVPTGVAVDPSTGDLLIADRDNGRIRRVSAATGVITTVAGDGGEFPGGNNLPATSATLGAPTAVAIDPTNSDILLAEGANSFSRIRRVSAATGLISTVAGGNTFGYNGDGIPASSALLQQCPGRDGRSRDR